MRHGARKIPPTAQGVPWLGVAHRISMNKFEFAGQFAERYGDVVRLPTPRKRHVYLISSPELVADVFVHNARSRCKGVMLNAALQPVPGTPFPVMEGDEWRKMRRLVTPFFSVPGLKAILPAVDEILETHVDRLEQYADRPDPVDVTELLELTSFDVMMRTVLNLDLSPKRSRRIVRYWRYASEGAAIRWAWFWLPMPLRFLWSARKDIPASPLVFETYRLVREKRSSFVEGKDLFSAMRDAEFDDGTTWSERQLFAEMFNYVFAGFETTAAAMAWTLGMLTKHPEAMAAVQREAASLGRAPTHADLDRFPYIRACWDEAQRIQGLPYYSRDSREDQVLGGYFIPSGSVLLSSPYAMQNDSRFWSEPELFQPERWLDNTYERNAYLPVGVGERRCIGAHMANVEGVLYLAKILRRFDFSTDSEWIPRRHFRMATALRGGLPIRIRRRALQDQSPSENMGGEL
ncbi:cytochrome P450 [Nocardia sp. Marseille-Q1738]